MTIRNEQGHPEPRTQGATDEQQVAGATDAATAEEAFGQVLRLVRTIQTGMQNIDNVHGLSGSQLWALWQISAQQGLRVTELATAQHLHPSTASNLLDKLEARGLIRRDRGDADQRVVRVYLTDTGLNLINAVPGPMQGRLRGALREVSAPVLAGLLKGVSSVLTLMEPPAR